jgi:hypothetical protein
VDPYFFDLIRCEVLLDALAIFRRQDDVLHPGALGGQKLLFNAAYR